jgi:hypothetical protein
MGRAGMTKDSKLREKDVRIPDIRQAQRDELITQYLKEVEPLHHESARSQRFGMLLHALFAVVPDFIEDFISGVEKYLKVRQKDRILKGRADNLFGNVVIEFEADLAKTGSEAEEQLRRYVAILWSREVRESRTPYLCLAADGVRFITYTPSLADPQAVEVNPEDVCLEPLEDVDWRRISPLEAYFWLDRYFFRQEIYSPTSERMEKDFGVHSHAFRTAQAALLALWGQVKERSSFAVVYDAWEKYLRIVYGSKVAADELFVRHTYLATLAKLLAWMRLTDSPALPDDLQIIRLLEGRIFKDLGIDNFLEEDFFSWVARPLAQTTALKVVRGLFSLLQKYHLRDLSEDVLKSLYQELVDPETRHDLGEFYTPDWLAHRMVNRMLDGNPRGAMLDPSCGSGTFLYLAIKEKRRRLGDSGETLDHIFGAVFGVDIHPLAVITAKTNYILALGDLLKKRTRPVVIPVFLANTIALPEREVTRKLWQQLPSYWVNLYGHPIKIPELLMDDLSLYDRTIEHIQGFVADHRGKPINLETFHNFLRVQRFPYADQEEVLAVLFPVAETLKLFLESDRDTIWAFVLKNIYKPLFLKKRFDFLMGNPPWIAFRYLEPDYQKFIRQQVKDYYLMTGKGHLITHLEVAGLFLVRAADLYLKEGGTIAFVMPRAVFTADQHDELRRGAFRFTQDKLFHLVWTALWDCDQVAPLFNVPACVVWGEKTKAIHAPETIPGEIISGSLPGKNAALTEAEQDLSFTSTTFAIYRHGKRSHWDQGAGGVTKEASYYKKKFENGATIYPRTFWFVEIKPSPLGFNPDLPPLAIDPRAIKEAKKPYHDVLLTGQVESRFLYATLLSTDLLPFGHLGFRLVVLPIVPQDRGYQMIDAEKARKEGFSYLAKRLGKVEEEWVKRRGAKAGNISALNWLDYRKKLTLQNPNAKYFVVYNSSGTIPTAALVKNEPVIFYVNGQEVKAKGFLVDHVTFYLETDNINESYYLISIFNASRINEMLKPLQARGLWGPRHIHKKVLELPIPQYEAENPRHQRLAVLGEQCSGKVQTWLAQGGPGHTKSIGRLRQMVRATLKPELEKINNLVKEIL